MSTLHSVEGYRQCLYIENEKQINLIPVSQHCWFQFGSQSVKSINSMVLNNKVAAADKRSVKDMMIEQVFSKSVLASRMQSWSAFLKDSRWRVCMIDGGYVDDTHCQNYDLFASHLATQAHRTLASSHHGPQLRPLHVLQHRRRLRKFL